MVKLEWPDDMIMYALNPLSSEEVETRTSGDCWLVENTSCLSRLRSVVSPHSHNFLLKPLHPDAANVAIIQIEPFSFDQRLW